MAETRPLRVGIDARELVGAPTGVGRYLFELADRWRRRDATRPVLLLYVPDRARDRDRLGHLAAAPGVEVREVGGAPGTLWEQAKLAPVANRDRLDVFFAPAYSAPLAVTAPVVVTIHDVSFMAHPEWFPWLGGLRRRALVRWSAQKAARIVTVSEFSASEIRRFLDVAPDRLDVIPSGLPAPERFAAAGPRPPREPLALFAGSIFNRRHVPDLVRAFARVARAHGDARLVIAGENRSFPREDPAAVAADLGIADRVVVRPYVTDAELGGLYSRARAFAFLSEYEGFGFTPLEAIAHGVPAIVCDTPVAREICRDAVAYVPCGAVKDVARALERLLYEDEARAALLSGAPAVLERYSWDRAAEATLAVLAAAAAGGGPA